MVAPCVIHFNGCDYVFVDVIGDGDCAFEVFCRSKMIPKTTASSLRQLCCQFARSNCREFAERVLPILGSSAILHESVPSLDSYLNSMSAPGVYAGAFEMVILCVMYHLNVVILCQTQPTIIFDAKTWMRGSCPEISTSTWRRTLHVLYHVSGFPDTPHDIPALNHYGLLIPVPGVGDQNCARIASEHFNRNLPTMKKGMQRDQADSRFREQERNTKRRREHRIAQDKERCDSTPEQSLLLSAHMSTSQALNILTDANMTDQEQSKYLQEVSMGEIVHALNRYTKLTGEEYIPTQLCAVCACKHPPSSTKRINSSAIPNFILLAAAPWHRTLDPTGDWVLLQDAIFDNETGRCVRDTGCRDFDAWGIDMCLSCYQFLEKGLIPPRSLASFDTGEIPEPLKRLQLTFVERMFLSVNYSVFHVFRVDSGSHRHLPTETRGRVSKGHVISFKHANTLGFTQRHILPHDPSVLPDLMTVSFIGSCPSIEAARKDISNAKQLSVRPAVIHKWASELQRLRPDQFVHDHTRLSGHVSGVPGVVFDMIDFASLVEAEPAYGEPTFQSLDDGFHDDYANRDRPRPGDFVNHNIDVVHTSGVVAPHVLSNGVDEYLQASLRKMQSHIVAVPASTVPSSDYNRRYFVDNYRNIFVHGEGERPADVPLDVYLQTLLLRPTTLADKDYSFVFEAKDVLARQRTLQRCRMSVQQHHSGLIAELSDGDLEGALRAIRSGGRIENAGVKALLTQLQISGADLRGTPQRLNRYRQQILSGLFPLFGPHDIWITLNVQESSSQIVLRIAGEQEYPIYYGPPSDAPCISKRLQVSASNPVAVAQFFHVFMVAFLDGMLGLPFGKNDFVPTHKGFGGWTKSYFFNLEVSSRATGPHAHGQIKIKGLDRTSLIRRFQDEAFQNVFTNYLKATFCECLPNHEYDVEAPTNAGISQDLIRARRAEECDFGHVSPIIIPRNEHFMGLEPLRPISLDEDKHELDAYLSKRLIRILRESGIHEHSATCRKNGHAGDDLDCRMSYPRPVMEEIAVFLDDHFDGKSGRYVVDGVEVIMPRDQPFVVAFNKWVTLATGANTSVEYMGTGRTGRARALYVTDYATKKPLSTYECVALFRANMQAHWKRRQSSISESDVDNVMKSCGIINRCLNALQGEVMVTGYEAAADVLGLPDHYASCAFVPLCAWTFMYSMIGHSVQQLFQVIATDSRNGPNDRRVALASHIQDYVFMDIPFEDKMTAYEFAGFYIRVSKRTDKCGTRTLQTVDLSEADYSRRKRGRRQHFRIGFTEQHPLCDTHHLKRVAKFRVPYQVGKQYPAYPSVLEEPPNEAQEIYAKYMLSIFRKWDFCHRGPDSVDGSWWSSFVQYLSVCEPWVRKVLQNMELALDRDKTWRKAEKGGARVSSNMMNHAESRFTKSTDGQFDWERYPDAARHLLQQLEVEFLVKAVNPTRPGFIAEQTFVRNTLLVLGPRFNHGKQCSIQWVGNKSLQTIVEYGSYEVTQDIHNQWQLALRTLARCSKDGTEYVMPNDIKNHPRVQTSRQIIDSIQSLQAEPFFLARTATSLDAAFRATSSRPSWLIADVAPSIEKTLVLWHLNRQQAQFAVIVLSHFHSLKSKAPPPPQLIAKCLGAPGTGKSQTMLAILWHMSQHNCHHRVATCAFTGGAAMLLQTPYTHPMTTCRLFAIDLKGPIRSNQSVQVLSSRIGELDYIFFDEFSFLSYRHLRDISEQIIVGMGKRADKMRPYGGMNIVFFGDYEQLSKPGDQPMYYGAACEESLNPEDLHTWYAGEILQNEKNATHDPVAAVVGRQLWTSETCVKTLIVQKRQTSTASGERLRRRCVALREEDFTDEFFDSLQSKAVGMEHGPDLQADEWRFPLYIVMRHAVRYPLDFHEAAHQATLQQKRFLRWRTQDSLLGAPLPPPLQLAADQITIKKIPRWQYYYEGMAVAFLDNKYFDAGNATNNIGFAVSITLHPDEPPDNYDGPVRELQHMPAVVLLYVPNSRVIKLVPNLPPKTIPMFPTRFSKSIRLGDNRYHLLNGTKVSSVTISRQGFGWIGTHAVTQYFSQGMSLNGRKCLVDLRVPPGGGKLDSFAESVLVMLSRHKDDDDWAPLHPLWEPGNLLHREIVIAKMRTLLCRNEDLAAELRRCHGIEHGTTNKTLDAILTEQRPLQEYISQAEYE